ncbi:hypothetical protein [Streptomyces indiaensis]|uniref:Uncharacterized protein n=1 Tax=Streptomyces indiaensis TaxID=284033 RepID=A0ABN3E742_9ACTN|nr:hypothetical protein [Streptomyces indiaensis]MCF1646861.1 hypothetical protein [Streptomyces indiaensis]
MPPRMLRCAATALLASAPLIAAAPAQAAPQEPFPCSVGSHAVTNNLTKQFTVSVTCDQARTVSVRITSGDMELAKVEKTVKAGVEESVTVTAPMAPVCATLKTDGESFQICG